MHDQPESTEEEQEQAPEGPSEEEPERDERAEGGKLPGDRPPEEPIHEA